MGVMPLASISSLLVALFVVFFVFTYFVVLNVMTGAFCSSAIDSAHRDRDLATLEMMANKELWMDVFRAVFDEMDTDQNGELDFYEFQTKIENPRMLAYFASLEIDASNAWQLF